MSLKFEFQKFRILEILNFHPYVTVLPVYALENIQLRNEFIFFGMFMES